MSADLTPVCSGACTLTLVLALLAGCARSAPVVAQESPPSASEAEAPAPPPEQPVSRFRKWIPSDIPIDQGPPDPEDAFVEVQQQDGERYGVRISLQVSRGGQPFREVPLGTPICDDDHVAFGFEPSAAGHVYVINHGTSGRWAQIFPHHGWEHSGFTAQQSLRLPTDVVSGFGVDGPAGDEHVLLVISPVPISHASTALLERLMVEAPGVLVYEPAPGASVPRVRDLTPSRVAPVQTVYAVGQGEQILGFSLEHAESCGVLP